MFILIGGNAVVFSKGMLGPMMGITSVLWVMMRNDSAINPKHSWMVFGIWSWLCLTYMFIQCNRVSNHSLYILLCTILASFCLCIVALVQKASLQGGIVTVIPPCTSFAAYTIAYLFPDRQRESSVPNDQSLA